MKTLVAVLVLAAAACGDDAPPAADGGATGTDGGAGIDGARVDAGAVRDGSLADAASASDGGAGTDGGTIADAAAPPDASSSAELSAHRDRLLLTLAADTCATWASFDESERAVFLTLTHRMLIAETPDGEPMIAHLTRLYLVLGGGADGTTCGGDENNRLFFAMDAYLWQLMVDTWGGARVIGDGGGSTFLHTRDFSGPHDPFDASIESDIGLSCTIVLERPDSRPPTAQAHFFLEGSAVAIERGRISLPVDPMMLEIDHDYDCIHRSNPTCSDFESRYRRNYGDFECEWVPSACTPMGTGCYRGVAPP